MASQSNLVIFGGAAFVDPAYFADTEKDEDFQKVLDALQVAGVNQIDVAQLYGEGHAEEVVGKLKALEQGFTVDTKWISGWRGKAWASKQKIIDTAQESYQRIGSSKEKPVNIFYLHSPDIHTPFEETLAGINDVYEKGGFKKFGLSNFTPSHVKEVLKICGEKGYIRPTVYQGSYAAVARGAEDELLPLLRENGLSFYAYSPIAGGFLTKNRKFIEDQKGRFNPDIISGVYHKMYKSETLLSVLDDWERISNAEGVSKAELAFRWINYHSALRPELGDGIVIGASRVAQITATTQYLKNGPLKESSAKEINELWSRVKSDAILDNFQAVFGGSA